ncbi:MAG TPA: 2-succinyl-5-enolpyruvyl-6-hydroxy-3-cyclohexene-1-carboxylic-acid synthase [Pantanalinema sp.]
MTAPNLNALWARVLLGALHRAGVRDVCVTPGSRSTPLAYAAHTMGELRTTVHIDERAAAFFALGLAKASRRPVALVCTSGTAAANYYPAIIEASLSGVPLIVLSADRPPELRGTGAAQTIDQVRLFGSHVRHFAETALPLASPASLRRLGALAAQAAAIAQAAPTGPVHLNVPFADPLPPIPSPDPAFAELAEEALGELSSLASAPSGCDAAALVSLAARIASAERGLIVAGPALDATAPEGVLALARRTGFPIAADVASGLRFHPEAEGLTVAHAEALLRDPAIAAEGPDLVIRVGGLPTSATLNKWLERHQPWLALLQPDLARRDPEALAHLTVAGDVAAMLDALTDQAPPRPRTAWGERLLSADRAAAETFEQARDATEALAVRDAIRALPPGSGVFLSSSMSIRYADALCGRGPEGIRVLVSRGANGIDGITSTALGAAKGLARPTLLVTGDLAFLHDLGGLLAVRHLEAPFVALVLNNDGGAIFSHLPISGFPEIFEPYFGTPHGLRFEGAAGLFGLDHAVATTPCEAAEQVARAMTSGRATIVEVPTARTDEALAYQALMKRAAAAGAQAFCAEATAR